MSYRVAGAFFAAGAAALLGLAFYGVFLSRPYLHLAGSDGHYLLSLRWVAGWALFAAFLAGTAFRYCSNRARGREPSAFDAVLFSVAKVTVGIATFLDLAYLLIPLP